MRVTIGHKTIDVVAEQSFLVHYRVGSWLEKAQVIRFYDQFDEIWYQVIMNGRTRYMIKGQQGWFFFDQPRAQDDMVLAQIVGEQIQTHYSN